MIGMNFESFLSILILGLIAAVVLHYAVRYRMLSGFDGFLGKWIAGWIGAWLGSPVLGHWAFRISNVYVIPGIIGAFAAAFAVTASMKAAATATVTVPEKVPAAQFEMRKVS
ncbi:MAG TPA: hypothetical protein VNE63_14540 [Candidatus Acidoferrales bacterium]|nr:hypothetical protein [Candidatus Acidoferrales bacterium]